MARRQRSLVPLLWKRELGVQREWPDEPADRQHQRSPHSRDGPQIPLAAWPQAGRSSRRQRTRIVGTATPRVVGDTRDVITLEYLKEHLDLRPLPAEGGYHSETYRSRIKLAQSALPSHYTSERSLATAIFYLLTSDTFSA